MQFRQICIILLNFQSSFLVGFFFVVHFYLSFFLWELGFWEGYFSPDLEKGDRVQHLRILKMSCISNSQLEMRASNFCTKVLVQKNQQQQKEQALLLQHPFETRYGCRYESLLPSDLKEGQGSCTFSPSQPLEMLRSLAASETQCEVRNKLLPVSLTLHSPSENICLAVVSTFVDPCCLTWVEEPKIWANISLSFLFHLLSCCYHVGPQFGLILWLVWL